MQRFDFGTVSENLTMPRLQSLLRRNPVHLPEQKLDIIAPARPAFAKESPAQRIPEPAPMDDRVDENAFTEPLSEQNLETTLADAG